MIQKLFDLLDDWRYLPAYRLERRSDVFFVLYLSLILKKNIVRYVYVVIMIFSSSSRRCMSWTLAS